MNARLSLAALLIGIATPALTDPLADMAGGWSGSGIARKSADAPEEAVRCRLDNTWETENSRLRIRGRCAVPGRSFEVHGALARRGDGRLRGFWSNPDGPGQTSISGRVEDQKVEFTFSAKDPATGEDVSQIVRWTLEGDVLRFVSWHRVEGVIMADITLER